MSMSSAALIRVVFIVEALGIVYGFGKFLASSSTLTKACMPQVCDAYDPLIHL